MKIGFAGLGHLGSAIASRLKSQGVDLTVWNRSSEKAAEFGTPCASTPAELIANSEVVFLCLFDSDAVDAVLNGEQGILSGNCRGKTVIDLTTNHFERVRGFHSQVSARGANYLEAPVLGSVIPATQGKLVVIVSGDEGTFRESRQLLGLIGEHVFYLPQPAAATQMKLINNMLLGTLMGAIGEALVLAEKLSISKKDALEILSVGGGKSGVMAAKQERLLNEDFSPHFTAALIHKDLRYFEELAEAARAVSQFGTSARRLYDLMMNEEEKGKDFCAIYDAIRRMNPDQ